MADNTNLQERLASVEAKIAGVHENIDRTTQRLHKAEDSRTETWAPDKLLVRSETLQTRTKALTAEIATLRFKLAELEIAHRALEEEELVLLVITGTI